MSLQPNEVLIIVLVALIVLGPKRLPGAIRGIGRAFRQVRDFSTTVRQEMDATISPPTVEPASPPARPPSEGSAAVSDEDAEGSAAVSDGDAEGSAAVSDGDAEGEPAKPGDEKPASDGVTSDGAA